jgi:hypothetical protein
VEHFKPKSRHADSIYEWSNYRLVCAALNGCKGDHEDVLDPFAIRSGTFEMTASFRLQAGRSVDGSTAASVASTIKRLHLNRADRIELRRQHWQQYLESKITAAFLRERAPFVAHEMQRLGLLDAHHQGLVEPF